MAQFKMFRETVLPVTLEPYSIYYVAPASKPNYVEIYVSDATGSTAKRVLNDADIQAMIDSSISGLSSIPVVDDIAERDALTPTANQFVYVIDATADPTVTSGSASYLYNVASTTWIKVTEYESLDLVLSWANLQDKPTSTVADIDDAVARKHSHSNKTELDKIGEDGNGYFTYNGSLPVIAWNSISW